MGGALLAYEMAATPPITVETPPVIHPIFRLLSGVPGSRYIDSIATRPAARGRGLAGALTQAAEARAKAAALPRLTLIALSSNSAARPLYFDLGYTDIAEEALIPSDWAPAARSAFLMEKSLA